MTKHLFIPDVQLRPEDDPHFLAWIGQYAAEKRPDVIVQIGDFADMASLSSYDRGKKSFEGRRYKADIEAANKGWEILHAPLQERMDKTVRAKRGQWKPELHYTLGNHEARILRAIEDDARLDGTLGYQDFVLPPGWQMHDFLEVVWVDGIAYSHFFANQMSGRPIGGSIENRLRRLQCSFVAGHEQTIKMGVEETPAGRHWGIVCGACYLHDEAYRGPQSNKEWRGIVMLNEVKDGSFDPMLVSLEFLCRKFEGISLDEYKKKVGL